MNSAETSRLAAPQLEAAVLGALILEPDYLAEVSDVVDSEVFDDPANAVVFTELLAMSDKGARIDLYTLSQRPGMKGQASYLAGLTSTVGSGTNCVDHARRLKELQLARQLLSMGQELSAKAQQGSDDVANLLQWAGQHLDRIAGGAVGDDTPQHFAPALSSALREAEARQLARIEGRPTGITTGLTDLDRMTGGWQGGQLVVLAGRPAMGKSAVMLHFAKSAALQGVPVCVYSLEMSEQELCDRLLLGCSDSDKADYKAGAISPEAWTKLEQAEAMLSPLPVYLNSTAGISMRTIRAQCRLLQKRGRCGMVVVDYLQLLDTRTDNRTNNREREIAEATRAAKMLAKELNIPVVMLSQLSRKVEERVDKTPLLSDLRESGAIEQDADIVAFIDRPAMNGIQTIDTRRHGTISTEGLGRFILAKQRNGPTGTVMFRHNAGLTQIADFETASSTDNEPF